MRSSPRKPAWPSFVWNTSALGRAGEVGPRLDRAHAADAEQELLQQPVLATAAVQPVGDRAQALLVLGDVGVEQQQPHPSDGRLPDPGVRGTPSGSASVIWTAVPSGLRSTDSGSPSGSSTG